jgi:hypothetical protein
MEFLRLAVEPTRQAVQRMTLRSWEDEYGDREEDVVLLAGEVHVGHKAGGLRFTTPEPRADVETRVLHYTVPVDGIYALAEQLAARMRGLVDGRLWMGAQMRRGDCKTVWSDLPFLR